MGRVRPDTKMTSTPPPKPKMIIEPSDDSMSVGSESASDHESSTVITVARVRGEEPKGETIADEESVAVWRWKVIVVLMLGITAALILTSTYIFISRGTEDEFNKSFDQNSATIMDAAEFTARNNIQVIKGFADSLTASAQAVNATWPFFTADDFEIIAAHARLMSFSETIMYMPMVYGRDQKAWHNYSQENQGWLEQSKQLGVITDTWFDGRQYFKSGNQKRALQDATTTTSMQSITDHIFCKAEDQPGGTVGDTTRIEGTSRSYYAPVWQVSPPPINPLLVNYNFLADSVSARLFNAIALSGGKPVVSEFLKKSTIDFFYDGLMTTETHQLFHDSSLAVDKDTQQALTSLPHSVTMAPIYGDFRSNTTSFVGYVAGIAPWDLYLSRLLPDTVKGVYAVLSNSCAQTVTYIVHGPVAVYLGEGDMHDPQYSQFEKVLAFTGFGVSTEATRRVGQCDYIMKLYPSAEYKQEYDNNQAIYFTLVLGSVFFLVGVFFFIFLFYVQRRQNKVMDTAIKTSAIVTSLFPSNVRERIFDDAARNNAANDKKGSLLFDRKGEVDENNVFGSKPIADLYPEATLMFSDLVGFTAWSSVRAPTEVFTLLESVYFAFDKIASRRRIFKVETVGDCYVAVAGLPDPRKDHAVVMARFADDCQHTLGPLLRKLEVSLGPDTGDLSMRFGLHSGPVTGGVLRGDRARFQLFGDTINTASRIESTGVAGRIHLSKETADLIIQAGKPHWIVPRSDTVVAKGKGTLQTFWLEMRAQDCNSVVTSEPSDTEPQGGSDVMETAEENYPNSVIDDKTKRLIDWNVDLFLRMLREIAARRQALSTLPSSTLPRWERSQAMVIDEVKEIIALPTFNAEAAGREVAAESIDLGPAVEAEMRDYVTSISMLYRDNPFHNFEHASHVTMSVVKLLSRIIKPNLQCDDQSKVHMMLHDHTYGITSDPLTQFACVYSALIHDVDHRGVPNTQLIKEGSEVAKFYQGKSVAEQNSVDIAWDLLMDLRFTNLRNAIYVNDDEMKRFRELVVNSVMATDIMDKELKALRNGRWDKAFSEGAGSVLESKKAEVDRKATIVIEHLIQASDVAHTMQHWHIYRKWNKRLFYELYKAYQQGRADSNPAIFWYKGELGFFDYYIIPLANKLKDCGVFGVSSVEYLNYAVKNRTEWELKGQEIVAEMAEAISKETKIGPIEL